mmetsp:Transcript_10697/g.16999  ORF Transcript_10697/g.16999 Transcript_10697/m.16999 type:complete len:206 (+) Transcript_10697:803-1420(+)
MASSSVNIVLPTVPYISSSGSRTSALPPSIRYEVAACMKQIVKRYMMRSSRSKAQERDTSDWMIEHTMSRSSRKRRITRITRSTRTMRKPRSSLVYVRLQPDKSSSTTKNVARRKSKIFHFQSAPTMNSILLAAIRSRTSATKIETKVRLTTQNQSGSSVGGMLMAFLELASAKMPTEIALAEIERAQKRWKAVLSTRRSALDFG